MAPQPGKHMNEEDDPELEVLSEVANSLTTMTAAPLESPRPDDDENESESEKQRSQTEMPDPNYTNGPISHPNGRPGSYTSLPPWMDPTYKPTKALPWETTMQTSASKDHDYEKYTSIGSDSPPVSTAIVPVAVPTEPNNSDDDGWSKGEKMTTAAGVPILLLLLIGAVIFFCMRKRRKQKKTAAAQAQTEEMKMTQRPVIHSYMAPPAGPPPAPYPGSHDHLPSPTMPAPVILGPIAAGSNGAYFTGIDTSDVMSVNENQHHHHNERTGLGDPFADSNSLQDEPPPPYRPRSTAPPSLAPSSRHASLRIPPPVASATTSQTHLIPAPGSQSAHPPMLSPFADPMDDDAVSELGSPTVASRRGNDAMSDVSDLSYQAEPVISRRAV